MFNLLSSVERIIIAGLIAVICFLSYSIYNINKNLVTANTIIENQALKIENSAIQAEYLTQSINLSEEANAKLLKERASLAQINEQYSKDIQALNEKHFKTQQQITQLRNSTNEHIKTWANSCVPSSSVSLLTYARAESCNQNSSANAVQVRNTTGALN